ncbi:AraC family transcriptional regulator N-terminal domain-containing protein [Fundicoccus sp. Sow4_H7]|uniref:AraC family transcriptional regulator n=1 Tax=Fundicoccus sp. Sow4_H7 TaxID=3438784 RepID=UPI003F9067F5
MTLQKQIAVLVENRTGTDGSFSTAIPSLSLTRVSQITVPTHGVYKTSLCVIVQGEKEVLLGTDTYRYNSDNYLVASVDLPAVVQVTKASIKQPYLGVVIEIQPQEIFDLLREMPDVTKQKSVKNRGLFVSPLQNPLLDAVNRYVRLLDTPEDILLLGPLIKKEIIYRLLQAENGDRLKQLAVEGSATEQITQVIQHIMQNYDQPLKIESLANEANLSVSTLYRYFKEVTTMSPIQFQKQMRLHEARGLLLTEAVNAADVAYRVGYESPSQFSREYARLFGRPPKEDVKFLEQRL